MKYPKGVNFIFAGVLGLYLFFVFVPRLNTIYAATKYWIGTAGGNFSTNSNWSTTASSSCGSNANTVAPTSTDVATFVSSCTNSAALDIVNVQGIAINSGYTGTLTQNTGVTVTIDSSGYTQAAGTFTGGDSAVDINNGLFSLTGGTFTNSSGGLFVERNFTVNGGTFTNTGKTVTFDGDVDADDSTITCSGTLSGTVVIDKDVSGVSTAATVASGCTISLGATPTTGAGNTNGDITNNGTITVSSGTWTLTSFGGDLINNGIITHSGSGWDFNSSSSTSGIGGLINNVGATITYSGTSITDERIFNQSGTFDLSGITLTFDGGTLDDDTTLTCGSSSIGNIVINKTASSSNTVLESNCTITGGFTRTDGPISNPSSAYTLTVQGDFSMSTTDTFGGANLTLAFGGSNNQAIAMNAGDLDGGPLQINKSAGTATLSTNFTTTGVGGTCTVVEGTFSINGKTLTCGSTFTVQDGGILQRFGTSGESIPSVTLDSGSTVIFTGDGDSASDTVTVTTMATTYHHLTINSTDGTTDTFELGAALDVNGTFTLTAGTFDVSSSVYGITVGGGWTDTGSGSFTERTGTVTFDGSGTINSNEAFYNVTVNGSGITTTVSTNTLQVGGALTVTLGTLDMNGIGATVTGLTTVNGGTYTASTGIQTFNGGLTISSGTFTGSSGTVDVNGTLTLSGGTLTAPSSSGTLTISGNFTISGSPTFSNNGGTVTFDSTSASQTLTTNSATFSGMTLNLTSSDSANDNLVISGGLDIDGTLTITDGELKLDTNNPNVNVGGGLSITSAGSVTKGTGTWTFDGSGTSSVAGNGQDLGTVVLGTSGKTIQLSSSSFALTAFTISNGTFNANGQASTIGGAFILSGGTYSASTTTQTFNSSFTVSGGTFTASSGTVDINGAVSISSGTLTAPSGTFTVSGNWSQTGGTFTPGSNTITFDGSSGTQTLNSGGTSFSTIAHTAAGTLQLSTNALSVSGAFTNSAGTYDANALATTVTGTATISGGTYTTSTATQTFNGGLTVSGGTFTGSSGTVDVNGALTLSSGTFTAPSSSGTLTISGDFTHSGGTFTHNSGTVTLDGSDQTFSGSTTFNNFTKTVSTARTLTFPASATQTFAGTMTFQGASGTLLSLRSSTSGTQFRIDPQGTRTIQYLDVKDSYNINTTAITVTGFNITDSGNNTGWNFNTNPDDPSSLGPTSLTNGSWTTDTTPTFTFTLFDSDSSQTVRFRIQIDDSSDFSSAVVDYTSALASQGSTSFTVGQSGGTGTYTTGSSGQTLSDSPGYYWRVRTEDSSGVTSSYVTANSGAVAFKVDATDPNNVSLISSADKSYETTLRPTFRFRTNSTPDSTSGINKYILTIDNGTTGDFTIDDIPTSRTSTYSTNKFVVKYENFDDGDGSNNYISVYTTSSSSWGSGENNGELKEGLRTWTVKSEDNAGNTRSASYVFYADVTSPTLSPITLDALGEFESYQLLSSTKPLIEGALTDNIAPDSIEISFTKHLFVLGIHTADTLYLSEKVNLHNDKDGTSVSFSIKPSQEMDYGKYTLTVKGIDKAGLKSTEQSFLIQLVSESEVRKILTREGKTEELEKLQQQSPISLPELEKKALIRRQKEAVELTKAFGTLNELFLRILKHGFATTAFKTSVFMSLVRVKNAYSIGETTLGIIDRQESRLASQIALLEKQIDSNSLLLSHIGFSTKRALLFVAQTQTATTKQFLSHINRVTNLLRTTDTGTRNTLERLSNGLERISSNIPHAGLITIPLTRISQNIYQILYANVLKIGDVVKMAQIPLFHTVIGYTADQIQMQFISQSQQLLHGLRLIEEEEILLAHATAQQLTHSKETVTKASRLLVNSLTSIHEALYFTFKSLKQPVLSTSHLIDRVKIGTETFYSIVFDPSHTTISDVTIEETGKDYVVVSWKTNHYALGKVNYGDTLSYGKEVVLSKREKYHVARLNGLKPDSVYFFEVMSQNKNYTYDAYYRVKTKK